MDPRIILQPEFGTRDRQLTRLNKIRTLDRKSNDEILSFRAILALCFPNSTLYQTGGGLRRAWEKMRIWLGQRLLVFEALNWGLFSITWEWTGSNFIVKFFGRGIFFQNLFFYFLYDLFFGNSNGLYLLMLI